jgi:hypothetical protein
MTYNSTIWRCSRPRFPWRLCRAAGNQSEAVRVSRPSAPSRTGVQHQDGCSPVRSDPATMVN